MTFMEALTSLHTMQMPDNIERRPYMERLHGRPMRVVIELGRLYSLTIVEFGTGRTVRSEPLVVTVGDALADDWIIVNP